MEAVCWTDSLALNNNHVTRRMNSLEKQRQADGRVNKTSQGGND
jgi:hypothetical protein